MNRRSFLALLPLASLVPAAPPVDPNADINAWWDKTRELLNSQRVHPDFLGHIAWRYQQGYVHYDGVGFVPRRRDE